MNSKFIILYSLSTFQEKIRHFKKSVFDILRSNQSKQQKNEVTVGTVDYLPTKSKWVITIDVMLIIGKYFLSNKDYINVMKTSKRYHDLVQMYHFNPIHDYRLFINMETQHFYHKEKVVFKDVVVRTENELKTNKYLKENRNI